jgi:hypothetical protein
MRCGATRSPAPSELALHGAHVSGKVQDIAGVHLGVRDPDLHCLFQFALRLQRERFEIEQ